jgi:hypothetical protein
VSEELRRQALEQVYDVACPHCGERLEIVVEADVHGELVQDCEVCCRPMTLVVPRELEEGTTLRVEAVES